jgi:hypothetical protein
MLSVEIYRKSLRHRDLSVATDEVKKKAKISNDGNKIPSTTTTGAVVNLMSTDVSRITDFVTVFFALISVPIQLFVGAYFLYQLMGISCLYGLLVMIFILPANHFNAKILLKRKIVL